MSDVSNSFEKELSVGTLRFFEKNGTLHYEYRKRVQYPTKTHAAVFRDYRVAGEIPRDVYERGEDAIDEHVRTMVTAHINDAEKRVKALDEYAKNPDYKIEAYLEGVLLSGRIISADDSTLRVRLEAPYTGEAIVHYGFGAAMSGKHIFENGTFTPDALATAEELLIRIYKQEKHREAHKTVIDLAERLNRKH